LEDAVALTGRYDFRKTWTGKIVLRIEEEVPSFWSRGKSAQTKKRWRDANLMDLTARELRVLMDSRLRPLLMAQYAAPGTAAAPKQTDQAEAPVAVPPAAQMPPASSIASLDVLRKSRSAASPPTER
jgi:hypothetical protein